jgi:DNA-binding beta-propeller fold protein YncE
MQRKHLAAAAAAVALVGTALSAPAVADGPSAKPKATTLVGGLISPLSLAVSDDGTVYYAQNFAGSLLMKKPGKQPKVIYQDQQGNEVGAVSERQGSLRFAVTINPDEEGQGAGALLVGVGNSGKPKVLADLFAYEESKNPDGDVEYGFRSLPDGCEVPDEPPFHYTGIVESHPYATAQTSGRTYVADAAGNTILKYGRSGKLSTVAVLPPVPVTMTAEAATALEIPECTVGSKLYLEPVPTDVEVGPNGMLYVTSLPGGPEDESLGANGSVFRIDPATGKVTKVASGLVSATGVAVDARRNLFVTELFRGRIAKIKAGSRTPTGFLSTLMPGAIELRKGGDLYATTKVLIGPEGPEDPTPPSGEVVRIRR